MNNYMALKISPKLGNEAFARSCVAAFAAGLNPTMDQVNDIKTAVSEAVTNAIVHSGLAESDLILIEATIQGNTIHITVSDAGVGIADVTKAIEPFFTTKPDEERSGLGFTIMDAFMDRLEVISNNGVTVKMCKAI